MILCTILLDLFSFTRLLSPELEVIDKIISWAVFGILFYELGISKVFFEKRYRFLDLVVLFAYYLLIVKNLMVFLIEKVDEMHQGGIIFRLAEFTMDHQSFIITVAFYVGTVLLILTSFYAARNVIYSKKSLFAALLNDSSEDDEEYIGQQETGPSFFAKFFMAFMLYNSFFILIFNIMQEWLGFVEDDMITILSILAVLFIYRKHKENKINLKIIDDISEISESFYKNVISSIDKIRYLKLIATSILALQILTDFFIFVSPIFLGRNVVYYIGELAGHETIFNLIGRDLSVITSVFGKAELLMGYTLSCTFILLVMVLPSYFWYLTYSHKKENIPKPVIIIFFMSFVSFMFSPIMRFVPLDSRSESTYNLFGVDIIMSSFSEVARASLQNIIFYAFVTGLIAFFLLKIMSKFIIFLFTAVNFAFLIVYIFYFLKGAFMYFLAEIYYLSVEGHWYISTYFYFFMIILLIFYVFAAFSYAIELNKEFEFLNIGE